jgi:hypothetical protein
VCVLYLGDHDPSGLDMTRDVRERLSLLSRQEIQVLRLALNMDQVEALHPPENPAKITDSRAAAYIAEFGESSWELDAISPEHLARLVTEAVGRLREDARWDTTLARESKLRDDLQHLADTYEPSEQG